MWVHADAIIHVLDECFLQDRSCMIYFAVFNENLITFFPKNNQRRRKPLVDSYIYDPLTSLEFN